MPLIAQVVWFMESDEGRAGEVVHSKTFEPFVVTVGVIVSKVPTVPV